MFDDDYRLTQTDYNKDNARLGGNARSGIINLNFDPGLVEAFIAMVKNLEQIADKVEVVMLPKNHKWIQNPPEALARQAEMVEQIKRGTGVPFRDFQTIK